MKVTLIIRGSDMKRTDYSGAEVMEDVLKRTTGEEWTISQWSMCAGSTTMLDIPDNIAAWILKYDSGQVNRKSEYRLLTDIPEYAFKKTPSAPSTPEVTEAEGKKWKLSFQFPFQ